MSMAELGFTNAIAITITFTSMMAIVPTVVFIGGLSL